MDEHEQSTQDASEITTGSTQKPEPIVVGLGASAGGLAALKAFFEHVKEDSGLAFVVVVHLSPEHESHLADLLQPHVKMPVMQVTETVLLEANRVYVIPPGYNLSAIDTHLRLSQQEGKRAPIDHFFSTLARSHDGNSIGVILTGTGSDGTLGLKEIKEQGGLTVVQDPNEAEYDGMPQSALSTGLVDLVLPLSEIFDAIIRFTRTEPRIQVPKDGVDDDRDHRELLQQVFARLRASTGRDFSRYKRSTIIRRIQRRMQMHNVEELSDYVALLSDEPDEISALSDDFLINVTNFFRDPEVFQTLETKVIPQLFMRKPDESVRVWSVGCATGEEAYSLAILLLEQAALHEAPPQIQVFASDLDERSLEKARAGLYSGDIETHVSPERLKKFFHKENSGYRIRQEVRDIVVFAPHNLLTDPPFSRIDFIACRNVLIYLEREVQQGVVELFHFALCPNGFLVLGTSEIVESGELFRTEDRKHKLYRKRNVRAREPLIPVFSLMQARLPGRSNGDTAMGESIHHGTFHQRMVERYAPPSLYVSPDDKVVHLSEHVGRYLVHPGGTLTSNVFKLVREELQIELRAALHAARRKGRAMRSPSIAVRFNEEIAMVILHVRPAMEPEHEGFALVIFDEQEVVEEGPARQGEASAKAGDEHVRELEVELELTKQRLKAIIEEYETSQEELKASFEELQSSNEELRSIVEEVETSKEELLSMNQELQALNQENRHKIEELRLLSSDLQNLMTATDIATLFLDRELRILRFTPRVSELFSVRMTDRGRPLSDLTHRLGYDKLHEDAEHVLDKLVAIEREVEDRESRWFLTRVLPYRSTDDRIEGVVITFVEITAQKEMEEKLRAAKIYAESIIDTLHEPLLVLTPDLRVETANPAFYAHFQVRPEETEGRLIYELGNSQWGVPALRNLLQDVLPDSKIFDDYEVAHDFEEIGQRVMLLNARPLDHAELILLGIRDITELKQAEETLRWLNVTLEQRVDDRTQQVITLASQVTMVEQEERRRISQILHDDLQQLLFGIERMVGTFRQDLEKAERPELMESLGEVSTWIDQAITTTRSLTADLSPLVLHNKELADMLFWLQTRMQELHGFEVTVESDHNWFIPDYNLRVLVFHIVRELLFNVKKHAGVTQATVRLTEEDGHLIIHVIDEGDGFDEVSAREEHEGGLGLYSTRERLGLIGGRLEVRSRPGEGTHIEVHVPVALEQAP